MTEFEFDIDRVDNEAVRIVRKLAPLLADEHTVHVTAALVLMLASFITMVSHDAGVDAAEIDDTVDKMIDKIKRAVRFQRRHYDQFSHPGNA
jgi:hypothetical protein